MTKTEREARIEELKELSTKRMVISAQPISQDAVTALTELRADYIQLNAQSNSASIGGQIAHYQSALA